MKKIKKILIVILLIISFFIFYFGFNQCIYYYSYFNNNPRVVYVDTYFVINDDIQDPQLQNSINYINEELEKSIDKFYEETEIQIYFKQLNIINNNSWHTIEVSDFGNKQPEEVIDEFYTGKPVLVFVLNLDDDATMGVTSWDRNGALLRYNCSHITILHELGHIFSLNHYWFKFNLMYPHEEFIKLNLTPFQIGKLKRKIEISNWHHLR